MRAGGLQFFTRPFGWLLGLARRGVLVSLIIVATASVVLFLAVQVADRMELLRSAPQDNVQWSLAQLDVELLAVEAAANPGKDGTAIDVAKLRQRFDVFYSRIKTTSSMPIFRQNPEAADVITSIKLIGGKLDQLVPLIDSSDAELRANIAKLRSVIAELRPMTRQVTLTGIKLHAAQSDRNRAEFSSLLQRTAVFNGLLVLALGAAMLFALRQIKISKNRADALQISSDRNASTLVTSLDAIIIMNMNGEIVEFNEAATQTFGYSRSAAIGARLDELVVPERFREGHRRGLERFRSTGQTKVVGAGRIEMSALRSDGTEFPVEFSLGVTNSTEGQLVIAFLRDISKRIEQERELQQAHDEALEASKIKSQFLAVMSHEMRTPLNGVMAVLDILDASKLDAKQKKLVSTATTSAEILKQHVDDVLDLTRIQAGKFELFPRVFDMVELLEEVQSINVAVAEKRGNQISLDIEFTQPYFIADRKRIHQVLTNLVGNAIKFTRNGDIAITAAPVSVNSDLVTIEFRVKDTGIGIASDHQGRIFEDFVTLDSSYQRNSEGAGLGLPICRSIVEAMGGSIGVESEVGRGSAFWFQLPLKVGFARHEAETASAPLETKSRRKKHLKVLVVEDNETNRFVAGEMLQAEGCDVVMARDGAEGVDAAKAQRFDLILMDLGMPKMNGWDAARRIRASVNSKSRNSQIYALTAHALPEEQEALLKAGMQGCVLKPLRSRELHGLLQTVSDHLKQAASADTASDRLLIGGGAGVDEQVLTELHDMLGRQLFLEKLAAFTKEKAEMMRGIEDALGSHERENVSRAAHKLAGSAAVFGATDLQMRLTSLERTAPRGEMKEIRACLRQAKQAAAQFEKSIQHLFPKHETSFTKTT